MKQIKLVTLALLTALSIQAQSYKKELKEIGRFLTKEYPKNEPGAVILIAQGDRILLQKAYGLAALQPKRKMKANMVFPIASMSKQFTSAAILQLVEKGKLSLTDPIQKYVPYYPKKKYPITIHHLLSQTSGIPEYFDVDEEEFGLLAQEHTPKQIIEYYKDATLSFEPGTKWQYSNSNYPLLGAALEKVTGMSLQEYLAKEIFQPLGMNSSGLWYPNTVKKERIPTGYNIKNGKLYEGPKMVGSALYAPGGIVSSVEDLYRWNQALVKKDIVSPFIVEQLTTKKKTSDGKLTEYGYGFFLRNLQGSNTIEHGGNLFSFTSQGLYLPKEDIFICMLANTKFDRVQEISNYVASVLIGKPMKITGKDEVSAEILKAYMGTYELQSKELSRTFELKVFDNQLILHDPKAPQNDASLTPAGTDVFLLKPAKATFTFQRDADKKVVGYTITQKKDTFIFKKVN